MRIPAVSASTIRMQSAAVQADNPVDFALAPTPPRSSSRHQRIGRSAIGPVDRCRRELLAEALLDGFLGVDDCDYEGLVKFTRQLRDRMPALAVQLLKPLLRTDATPSVNVEQQAVFVFGDLPADMQQQIAEAASQAASEVAQNGPSIDVQATEVG